MKYWIKTYWPNEDLPREGQEVFCERTLMVYRVIEYHGIASARRVLATLSEPISHREYDPNILDQLQSTVVWRYMGGGHPV